MPPTQPSNKRQRTDSTIGDNPRTSDDQFQIDATLHHKKLQDTLIAINKSASKLESYIDKTIRRDVDEKVWNERFHGFRDRHSALEHNLKELEKELQAYRRQNLPAHLADRLDAHFGGRTLDRVPWVIQELNKELAGSSDCIVVGDGGNPGDQNTPKKSDKKVKKTPKKKDDKVLIMQKCRCRYPDDDNSSVSSDVDLWEVCRDTCSCKKSGLGCGAECSCGGQERGHCINPITEPLYLYELFGPFRPPLAPVYPSQCFAKWLAAKNNSLEIYNINWVADMIAKRYKQALGGSGSSSSSSSPAARAAQRWLDLKNLDLIKYEREFEFKDPRCHYSDLAKVVSKARWQLFRATVSVDAHDEAVGRYSFCLDRFTLHAVHLPNKPRCEDPWDLE